MSRKKVLIIVENSPVPPDPRVWHEACALRDAGYQVTILCPRGKRAREGHEVSDGVHIYRYPRWGEGNSAVGMLAEYGLALFWQALYSIWIYLKHGFHVIQGCNPPDTIVFIGLLFKLLGVKYVFDHHDAVPELYYAKYQRKDLLYRVQAWLEKITFRWSDVAIATNESYRAIAVERGGMDRRDVFVVRNGPDVEHFQPVQPNPTLKYNKPFLVGYVGAMGVQDGLDMLLDVALYLKKLGRQDIHITCVGIGSELEHLRGRVKDSGLDDMVDFPGWVSSARLLEILSTADVCVNADTPSEMNNISTMIKILEYMALGKPIIQCDFREGRFSAMEASLYADTQNPVPDFAEKIIWLLENPDERRRMGEFGQQRVKNVLAWKYSVPHLLAAYARVFEKKKAGPAAARDSLKEVEEEEPSQPSRAIARDLFYRVKPLVPRSVQIIARRQFARRSLHHSEGRWPIWDPWGSKPPGWTGWPGGRRFALVLTHDVELDTGVARCEELADLEEERGFRSAYAFVPMRYQLPEELRRSLVSRGFEVLVHDLYHDGKLFRNRSDFERSRDPIRDYLGRWQARGFAAGAMHHDLRWIAELGVDYDISTYDVDPFEPQPCGLGRIFPCWIESPNHEWPGYVELPYTLPQDFSTFILLGERTNALWRKKLDWIAENGGMALIKTHPDYMKFGAGDGAPDRYRVELYTEFLDYINARYAGQFWHANPVDVASYWRGLCSTEKAPVESVVLPATACSRCHFAHNRGWISHYPRERAV